MQNQCIVPVARDEMDEAAFNEIIARGLEEAQEEPVFKSSLTIDEIERNFDTIDVFRELREGLEEALAHSKGGIAMREYKWEEGRWLTDGHNWCMLLDIPKLHRVDTGERVILQPPRFVHIEAPPVECKIYYVPDANIYIALGENAYKGIPVLFYDMISLSAEEHKRFPNIRRVE